VSADRAVDTTAPLGRRERKKRETKTRIIDSAVALFATRGYDATTIEDIGESADVSRATVFNYFARKEDLILEVFRRRRADLAELIAEATKKANDTTDTLRRALGGIARDYEDDPATRRATVRAWLRAGGPLLPDASDSAALFTDVLRAGQQQGDIPPDLDTTHAGLVILDAYLGVIYRWVADEDGQYDFEKNLIATLDLILTGITRQPPTKPVRKRQTNNQATHQQPS
jgi:TetR/AcrR family transcriptional regulator, cholesterol catabolism regulator